MFAPDVTPGGAIVEPMVGDVAAPPVTSAGAWAEPTTGCVALGGAAAVGWAGAGENDPLPVSAPWFWPPQLVNRGDPPRGDDWPPSFWP